MCITRRFFLNKDSLPQNKVIYFTSLREIAWTQTSLSFITGISLKKSLVWVRKKRFSINFYNIIKLFIYRFRHNEIPVYIVGIILTTYVLVFHWYRDHFPSQYLSTGRLICYLSHTCKHSWSSKLMFSVISNFITLNLSLRFLEIDFDRRD